MPDTFENPYKQFRIAKTTAGGVIIAMLTNTIMPKAYELAGSLVAYAIITRF